MIYDILPVNNYDGNGSSTIFDFDFYIDSSDEMNVYLYSSNGAKTLLNYDIDYSINEFKNPEGSYITYPLEGSHHTILKEGEKLSLQMSLPLSQETQYNNSSLLNLSALEYSFDYLTRLIQIVARKIDLCIKAEEGDSARPSDIIENITSIGSDVLARAQEFSQALEQLEELSSNATEMYNNVLAATDTIVDMQNSLNSKVNVSGNNFSSSVKAMDGQWIYPKTSVTYVDLDVTTSNKQTFSLVSFLPSDSYNYELLIVGQFHHTVSGGNNLSVYISAQNGGNSPIPFLYSSSSAQYQHNSLIVPIGSERQITFKSDYTGFSKGRIYLVGYRRIGTNA